MQKKSNKTKLIKKEREVFLKNTCCEWYINGEEVENSVYVYSIYKNEYNSKIEFTIYFS